MSTDLTFCNKTTDVDPVKVCVYKKSDPFDWSPLGIENVPETKCRTWSPPANETNVQFKVKFFNPDVIDKLLAEISPVTSGQTASIHGDDKAGYTVTVQ